MSRLLALTLIASLGSGSAAFAGESLVQSAVHLVQAAQSRGTAITPDTAIDSSTRSIVTSQAASWVTPVRAGGAERLQQSQGQAVLSKSGMKKRTKVLIYVAAGVGFAATAYAIDHKVLNVTPSSLGTRQD
jgi:hypothetical protein